MPLIILIIFICLFILANKLINNNSLKRLFINIYMAWWLIWLELSIDTKGYLTKVNSKTYWFFILNVISFVLIYLLIDNKYCYKFFINIKNKVFKNKNKNIIPTNNHETFNIKNYESNIIIWIIEIILIFILTYYYRRYNLLLKEYGIIYARIIRFGLGYMLRRPIEVLFYNYVVQTLTSFIAILIPIHIINGKYKNPTIYLGLVIIFLYSQIGKERMIIFQLLLYFVLVFLIFYHGKIWKSIKKYWMLFLIVIIISALSMTMTTLIRLGTNFGSFKSIITNLGATFDQVILYFTGSIRAFDYSLSHDYKGIINSQYGRTIGSATFGGINEFFIMIIRGFGIKIPTANMVIGELTQQNIFIGANTQFNAFFSCIFNYYIDFGIMGIIFFGGIFGGFISFLIRKVNKTNDAYYIMILVLNLYIAIFSLLRWEYQSPAPWIIILLILIMRTLNKKEIKFSITNKVKLWIQRRK